MVGKRVGSLSLVYSLRSKGSLVVCYLISKTCMDLHDSIICTLFVGVIDVVIKAVCVSLLAFITIKNN